MLDSRKYKSDIINAIKIRLLPPNEDFKKSLFFSQVKDQSDSR